MEKEEGEKTLEIASWKLSELLNTAMSEYI
jgi:hypothetical protein